MPELMEIIRATGAPRAVERGRIDLESVMLWHLTQQEGRAWICVSKAALEGQKGARLGMRKELVDDRRIVRITEFPEALTKGQQDGTFVIERCSESEQSEQILMVASNRSFRDIDDLETFTGAPTQIPGRRREVTLDEVRDDGLILAPRRYLMEAPFRYRTGAVETVRLTEVFKVIRQKTTTDDPKAEATIAEVVPRDIGPYGDIQNASRSVSLRPGESHMA